MKRFSGGSRVSALVLLAAAGCTAPDGGSDDTSAEAGQALDDSPIYPNDGPTPQVGSYQMKGLQYQDWANFAYAQNPSDTTALDMISGNKPGRVAINIPWEVYEPSPDAEDPAEAPPAAGSCASHQTKYGDYCYNVDANIENQIKYWTDRGVVVTAILVTVPQWAAVNTTCDRSQPQYDYCRYFAPAAQYVSRFGNFAGMLARRYNGLNGHGRISDFVIHNEVNQNAYFNIGCGRSPDGPSTACDKDDWLDAYADNFNAAYDQIVQQQPKAKVLIPTTMDFDIADSLGASDNPKMSVKSLLQGLDGTGSRLGERAWRLAYHPYARNPNTNPDDQNHFVFETLPDVSFGNIGILVAWLQNTFPGKPWLWEDLHLTEAGISSRGTGVAPMTPEETQQDTLCKAFRNLLGTPGITSFQFNRMWDMDPQNLSLGLWRFDGNDDMEREPKLAWSTWALSNRTDTSPPQLSCGFEDIPYVRLQRTVNNGGQVARHWTSTRLPPAGFVAGAEPYWWLWRDKQPGTTMLYECKVGDHNMLSADPNCEDENQEKPDSEKLGPVGYIHKTPEQDVPPLPSGAVAIYRCRVEQSSVLLDHFISPYSDCESAGALDGILGYAPAKRPELLSNGDFDSGLNGWSSAGSGTTTVDTANPYDGNSIKIESTSSSNPRFISQTLPELGLSSSEHGARQYLVTYWARGAAGGERLRGALTETGSPHDGTYRRQQVSQAWRKYGFVFKTKSTLNAKTIRVQLAAEPGVVNVDSVSVLTRAYGEGDLINLGFEDDWLGWIHYGFDQGGTFTLSNTEVHSGLVSAHLTSGTVSAQIEQLLETVMAKGRRYRVRVYVKGVNGNETLKAILSRAGSPWDGPEQSCTVSSTAWTLCDLTLTIPQSLDGAEAKLVLKSMGAGTSLFLDDLSVVQE